MPSAETLVATYGIWAVLLGTFLEGETVLVLAGFAAHRGYLDPVEVALAGLAGGFAGDELYFFLGRWKGKAFLERRAKGAVLEAVRHRVARHPVLLIVGARFLYGLRTLIPALIGATDIPVWRFASLNLLGAAIWAVVVAGGGYLFGVALENVVEDAKRYEVFAIIAIAAIGIGIWTFHMLRRGR